MPHQTMLEAVMNMERSTGYNVEDEPQFWHPLVLCLRKQLTWPSAPSGTRAVDSWVTLERHIARDREVTLIVR